MRPWVLAFAIVVLNVQTGTTSPVSCETFGSQAETLSGDVEALQALFEDADRACRDEQIVRNLSDMLGRAHFEEFRNASSDADQRHHLSNAVVYLQDTRWQAHAALGAIHQRLREYGPASKHYQMALLHLEEHPHVVPPDEAVTWLLSRSHAARALAPTYVPALRNRSGLPGGLTARKIGGVVIDTVPFPVEFDFDKTTLNENGLLAVQDMFQVLSAQKPDRIVLVGHTDPKGSYEYNEKLSLARAESVRRELIKMGLTIQIDIRGAGEYEPAILDDPTLYTEEENHQIMRRVVIDRQLVEQQ